MRKFKSKTLWDAHKIYKKKAGILCYEAYRDICERFNQEVMKQIIEEGRVFDMLSRLSTIQIIRVNRAFGKLSRSTINWAETDKRKAELIAEGKEHLLYNKETNPDGIKWFVYYTNEFYCKFYWRKYQCNIPNRAVYRFNPTGGKKGNKTRLTELLKQDDLASLNFKTVKGIKSIKL